MEGIMKSLALIFTLCIISGDGRELNEAERRRIDRFILESMNCGRIPALNLALVREGQNVLSKGYGTADSRDGSRTTDSTVFGLSSLTEAFTALTLGKLLHRNESYSWDTPVKEFLGEDFKLGNKYITNRATLRDLVSHRTGLAGGEGIMLNKAMGQSELKNRMFFMPEHIGFRVRQTPSKLLYNLVQEVLEKIGGKPWDMLIREHLLGPIGMTSTKFMHEAEPQYSKFAMPMMKVNSNLTHVPWEAVSTINLAGSSGSLCSTSYDMAKWLTFLLQDGQNTRGHTVVRKDMLQELYKPATMLQTPSGIRPDNFNQPGTKVAFTEDTGALGWTLGNYRGYKTISKRGSWLGYESVLIMIPARRIGVFTSFSGQTGQKADAIKTLISLYNLDILLDGEPWVEVPRVCSTVDEMVSAMPRPKHSYTRSYQRTDKPHRPLPAYVGSYGNGLYGRLEISVSNDTRNALNLVYGQQGRYRLFPTGNLDEFFIDALGGPLWFSTRADEYIRWGPLVVRFNSSRQEREAKPTQQLREEGEEAVPEGEDAEGSEEKEEEDTITGIAIPSFDPTVIPVFRRDFVLKQAFKEVKESHYNECDSGAPVSVSTLLTILAICFQFLANTS